MNALELRELCKSYDGFSLDRLNLTLPAGCIMGLIGENGAGKSTTIKLILGLIRRDSGSITVLGRDNAEGFDRVREEIGVVLDEAGIPECLTTKQVGAVMARIYKNWDAACYGELMQRLSIPAGKAFKDFSRGTKMKLCIAVALSHRPKLLLLDEPTSGLDPLVREEVVEMFSEFTRDASHAILISSHIVSDLEKLCDYIAFLHRGKLLLCEEKDQLLERFGVLRCTEAELAALDPAAVRGKRVSAYGVEAVVERARVPHELPLAPVSIEDLFVYMAKEEN